MPRALNLLRPSLHYRRDAFTDGLRAGGFELVPTLRDPRPGDAVLIWNRYAGNDEQAKHFEQHGATALVAENSPLGNGWRGGHWFSLARSHVALTGGEFRAGGPARWDGWDVDLAPFRTAGETVVLAQRGIGHKDVRSPDRWAESVRGRFGARIRPHPGTEPVAALAEDLKAAGAVITWSSAAAIQALMLGVPVWHAHPLFVGAGAARPLSAWPGEANRDENARLALFRRLAWAMWDLEEIRSGEPIRRLMER